MLSSRVLPVLSFVISSLVLSSLLRTPRVLKFYLTAIQYSDDPPKLAFTDAFTNVEAAALDIPTSNTHPPLSTLIEDARPELVGNRNQTIIGDPQFLLDFAIVGYPKCGTSSMASWIGRHPSAQIKRLEMQHLSYSKPANAIWYLYNRFPEGNHFKRGYKSPFDVTNKGGAMDSIRRYWPQTKLIVGIRHPIKWFESFYNFRLQRNVKMPSPDALLRRNIHGFGVKTANFHVYLARLGKTNMTAPEEVIMKENFPKELGNLPPPTPNKIFLYAMEQLADGNETRSAIFRQDVQRYLGLEQEMPPIVHTNEGKINPKPAQAYIDICDEQYLNLRRELLRISKRASIWIRKYFLVSKDVHVSSREYVEEILETWMYDPCDGIVQEQ